MGSGVTARALSQRGALRRIDHQKPGWVAISRAQSQCDEHCVLLQNDLLTMARRIPMTLISTDDTIISNQNLGEKKFKMENFTSTQYTQNTLLQWSQHSN